MIPFTQYLRPNGRREAVEINRPDAIEAIAQRFIASGGRYTCEVLTNGMVSLAAEKVWEGEERDVVIVLSQNGPVIDEKVDELVSKSAVFI